MRKLQAIYEHGVLRPVEDLHLEEHQKVRIIVLDDERDHEPKFVDPASFEKYADRTIDREALLAKLAKIPGCWADDIRAERDER